MKVLHFSNDPLTPEELTLLQGAVDRELVNADVMLADPEVQRRLLSPEWLRRTAHYLETQP